MIARLAKDYKHYEILYESQEEAQAVVDYQKQLLARGFVGYPSTVFSCPNTETFSGRPPGQTNS